MTYFFNKKFDPTDTNSLQKFKADELVKIAFMKRVPLKKLIIDYLIQKYSVLK